LTPSVHSAVRTALTIVEGSAQENIMLVVPRALAAEMAPGAPPLHGRLLNGASGRLLAEHMLALVRHLPGMKVRDVALVRQATIGLIAAALAGLPRENDAPGFGVQQTMTGKLLTHIEHRLTDRSLSVASICSDVGISRASLYRTFAAGGGVMTHILRRRLEAAHSCIADESERRSMLEIADLYGFSSQAQFSTAFRRRFGYSPIRARGASPTLREVGDLFENWRHVIQRITEDPSPIAD
jgi:AraC-like DNA-binding protein